MSTPYGMYDQATQADYADPGVLCAWCRHPLGGDACPEQGCVCGPDRATFVQRTRDQEAAFLQSREGAELVSAQIGPWRCGCGYATRSAGDMFDHTQTCAEPEHCAFEHCPGEVVAWTDAGALCSAHALAMADRERHVP